MKDGSDVHTEFSSDRVSDRQPSAPPARPVRRPRAIKNAIRTELERENYGILKPKGPSSLAEYLKSEFCPYIKTPFRKAKPNTVTYYRRGAKMLLSSPLSNMKLDAITDREAGQFITANPQWKAAYVNKARRILPMIPDVLKVMKARHNAQGRPAKGCVIPTKVRTGHSDRGPTAAGT